MTETARRAPTPSSPRQRSWPDWVGQATAGWAAVYGTFGLVAIASGAPVLSASLAPGLFVADWAVVAVAVLAATAATATFLPWGRRVPRTGLLSVLWGLVVVCGLGAFGLLMQVVTLLVAHDVDSWLGTAHQALAATGAVLLAGTARGYRHRTRGTCPRCGTTHGPSSARVRREPTAAPRGVRLAAYIGSAAFLPYIAMKTVWAWGGTFAGVTGADMIPSAERQGGGGTWTVLESWGLDPTALLAALGVFLLHGLVHPWGQVFPRWAPLLTGRPVPRWLPLTPALLGAATLAPYGVLGLGYLTLNALGLVTIRQGDFQSTEDVLLVAWCGMVAFCGYGLALAVAARSYFVRTRPRCVVAVS
ncbi:hypothetical protein [Streptoalloteichus hindustanus]|uniref:Uncharacterized protein n=1 Tax=Streptoalloteichus hindustanus TaxID=2017 RepID=A0A1M5EW67_STRHI|nr:hypothetical protein [Streptoalloteichus hindustanus]SHF83341.1 hypothetical protein SAMN05444320_105161 [Streptoalloteichus hindustanus]